MKIAAVAALLLGAVAAAPRPQPPPHPAADDRLGDLVQQYLWPASDAEFHDAEAAVRANASLARMTRERFHDLEEALRRGPRTRPPVAAQASGRYPVAEWLVDVPAGPPVPVLVQLPARYDPRAEWPLMFAMHGGPPASPAQAHAGAERMLRVWADAADAAGWVVAAPALTPSVTTGERSEERLPYELFHPEQARAVIAALRARYRINPDRMVSTGISLGSNYSIAFGTSHPDCFSAIVPVSTEGDSRELLLRNLEHVPVYILEGSRDKNIREITGPRALRDIVASLGYDLTYREFGDRAHEGFEEHYGDVLRWLDVRPRHVYPRDVLRVPNNAITSLSRRVFWIEPDTRQAFVHAAVTGPARVDITARWARTVKVYLHDRLVNLDRPIEIRVNGVKAFAGTPPRSAEVALRDARARGDERLIDAAEIVVDVPGTPEAAAVAERAFDALAPTHAGGTLSFWETFAIRSLEERVPALGIEGDEAAMPQGIKAASEQVAVAVRRIAPGNLLSSADLQPGDLLLDVGGEPFFRGRGALTALRQWLMRELRSDAHSYTVVVWRGGRRVESSVRLKLGPYRKP
jgi:dienelactone hydrolase